MPIYSKTFTCPAGTKKEYAWRLEGEVIRRVSVRFPPGSEGELRVKIMYGLKSLAPFAESEWLNGDDEIIEWDEYIELPERTNTLNVVLENDDTTYPHSVIIRIVTLPREVAEPVAIKNSAWRKIDMFLSKLMRIPPAAQQGVTMKTSRRR